MAEYDGDVKLKVTLTPDDIQKTASKLRKEIQNVFDYTKGKELNATLLNIENTMRNLQNKSQKVSDELKTLGETKIPTEQYTSLTNAIIKIEGELEKLGNKSIKLQHAGDTAKNRQQLEQIEIEAEKLNSQMQWLIEKRQDLYTEGKDFISGKDTAEYAKKVAEQENLNNKMRITLARLEENKHWQELINADVHEESEELDDVNAKQGELNRKQSEHRTHTQRGVSVYNLLHNAVSKVLNVVKKLATHSKRASGDLFNTRSIKRALNMVLKYAFGIRSIFLLYRKIRQSGKQSLQLLAKESDVVNENMSALLTVFTQLKNSIGTIVQPILRVLTPVLVSVGEAANNAVEQIANFFAVLTGQDYYYRAIKIQKDYRESLDGTAESAEKAKNALASFDKLDVINKNNTDSSSGSESENLFEKVDVDKSAESLMDKFNQIWDGVDFTSSGTKIGAKLRDALDAIPWDDIKTKAQNVAFSFGTLVNGFFTTPGLPEEIGQTIANAINTGVGTLHKFISTVKWDKIGSFIASAGNQFFTTLDVEDIAGTISDALLGALRMISTFLRETDFKQIGKKTGQLFGNIKWKEILFESITVIKEAIVAVIDAAIGLITENPFLGFVASMAGLLSLAFKTNFLATGEGSLISSLAGTLSAVFESALAIALAGLAGYSLGKLLYDNNVFGIGDAADRLMESGLGNTIDGFLRFLGLDDKTNKKDDGWVNIKDVDYTVKDTSPIAGMSEQEIKDTWDTIVGSWMDETNYFRETYNKTSIQAAEDAWGMLLASEQAFLQDAYSMYGFELPLLFQKYMSRKYSKSSRPNLDMKSPILDNPTIFKDGKPIMIPIDIELDKKGEATLKDVIKSCKYIAEQHIASLGASVAGGAYGTINNFQYKLSGIDVVKVTNLLAEAPNIDATTTMFQSKLNGIPNATVKAIEAVANNMSVFPQFQSAIDNIDDVSKKTVQAVTKGDADVKTLGNDINAIKNKEVSVDVKVTPFQTIINKISEIAIGAKDVINKELVDKLNQMQVQVQATNVANAITGGVNMATSVFKVPKLAQGAVIPANREFLAVLGDQRQGTNIEAPLDTIVQAMQMALANTGGGHNDINLYLDGKQISKVVWDETQKRYKQTGTRFA